ncbi:OLC1v1028208C1 [Oldenlandia corymbosa var. corymbosa]|uniref:OLC1v1028208C1 n=1 Tax=Oldenlandia corymbosa var. corymbosa TaxID=529605 RepID=A0AAV1CD84_OLDCO|nr:OLC1v1028208C1 [Oldenlandia corymbosa var. corymbosa]
MEEQLSSLAITHLLQHTLRSLCIHENSQWVYAVFWRILPRNYPPPKWDCQAGVYDRSRGNRRNWILVWEDGFCNFAASTAAEISTGECPSSSVYGNCEYQHYQGLQPELFFKMSHEIYNYGEGLIGKVAADHSHKWIHKEPNDQEINFLSAWHNSADSHPRTWEAQFQSGIKTIALIAVREGVIQLGAVHKVVEDLSYVVLLRKKFSYIESIPGVLLPHPSSLAAAAYPSFKVDGYGGSVAAISDGSWHFHGVPPHPSELIYHHHHHDHHHFHQPAMKITPSMSSLEALLSKLPSVVPSSAAAASSPPQQQQQQPIMFGYGTDKAPTLQYSNKRMELMAIEKMAKEEEFEEDDNEDNKQQQEEEEDEKDVGESSSSMSSYHHHHQHFAYVSEGMHQSNGY